MRSRLAWCAVSLSLMVSLIGYARAEQVFTNITIKEINPSRSTLDADDPDGATGGRVNGLGRARDGRTFYAASEWGGLFKSTDKGLNWQRLDGHLPVATWDVEVDPSNSNRVYATSFYDGRVNSIAGINVSTDGGATWQHPVTAAPPPGFCVTDDDRTEPSAFGISIDPDQPSHVFIGTSCGLAASSDAGATWKYIDPTPADGADRVWDVVVHHGGIIDLCGDDGHRRSTDAGATWTSAVKPLPVDVFELYRPLQGGPCSIAASPDEAHVLVAVAGTSLFETDDGGGHWSYKLKNPKEKGRIPFVATNRRSGGGFDLWFGDEGLYRARCRTPESPAPGGERRCPYDDWAGSYTRRVGGHDDMGDIAFDPQATTDACPVLMSSDGGVYYNRRTSNSNCHRPRWEQPDTTPHALWVYGMTGAHQPGASAEDLYFGNQDNGSFASLNASGTAPSWRNAECCDGFTTAASPTRVLYVRCCWPKGRRSRLYLRRRGLEGGGEVNSYPPGLLRDFSHYPSIARFGPNDFAVVTSAGVFMTRDVTAHPIVWQQLDASHTPPSPGAVYAARRVEKVSLQGTTFYVRANGYELWRLTLSLLVPATPPPTWQQVSAPPGSSGIGIFAVDPRDPNRLMAEKINPGIDPSMIRSNDGGASWLAMPALDTLMTGGGIFKYGNRRGPSAFTYLGGYRQPTLIAFDPEDENVLVAGGADSGLFVSMNDGASWKLVSDPLTPTLSGLPHIPRPHHAYFDHEPGGWLRKVTNIHVGTQGRGVWRISLGSTHYPGVPAQCVGGNAACVEAVSSAGRIGWECGTRSDCVVVGELPRLCGTALTCRACEAGAACPTHYRLVLDDLDTNAWDLGLFTEQGELAPYELTRTSTGAVLVFSDLFNNGTIRNYRLIFAARPGARGGRASVRVGLETTDSPKKR